jgi:hypothetical protein
MSRKLLMLGMVLCAISLVSGCQVTGSGNLVTRRETFMGFDRLDVSSGFKVDVRQADSFSVVIRIDDNLERYLQVVQKGSTLQIGLRLTGPVTLRDATLQADVTMPELTGLQLSGGSHCTASGFESTRALDLDASGGSHATLSGSAGDATIDASGGSHTDLSALVAASAKVEASGGSHVTVNVTGRLDADASSGSHVYYLGSPTLGNINESSGSSVRRK